MADLAIKGHATRGKEVIELLEMLGGKNIYNLTGTKEIWYVLSNSTIKYSWYLFKEKGFSLEEFLEKFPYKVGDKVTLDDFPCEIKGMSWEYDDIIYYVKGADFSKAVYSKDKDLQPYKEETMEEKLVCNENEIISSTIDTSNLEKRKIIFSVDAPNETELVLGDNFEIKVEDGKTYVVKKKPQYPKTYEECCSILGCKANDFFTEFSYDLCDVTISDYEDKIDDLLQNFRKLIYCRDAYWKIAGEELGLGKPWKPDWANLEQDKHCIWIDVGDIILNEAHRCQHILAFPTAEMCNAFYENFKNLIEACKELL